MWSKAHVHIKLGKGGDQRETEQSQQRHLGDHGVADGAADVVKVDVDAVGTALAELGSNVVQLVVDGC